MNKSGIKIIIFFLPIIIFFAIGCHKENDLVDDLYLARIIDFDRNCQTCIISFMDESKIQKILGPSENNYYQTANLNKDNFEIGEILKVKVRKTKDSELNNCITLYPSFNYQNIYIVEYEEYKDLMFGDTIVLAYQTCLQSNENSISICFDSVLTDSRCPLGGECIWAGEAIARFQIKMYENGTKIFDMHPGDTQIIEDKYKIYFVDLLPYPTYNRLINNQDYIAKIVINQN
jgi:hypothetical protein